MKKLIVLLLALGIVGAFAAGCSGGDDSAPATTAGAAGDTTGTDGD